MNNDTHYRTTMDSPVGELTIVATTIGLRAVLWPLAAEATRVLLPKTVEQSNDITEAAKQQLNEYFAGNRTVFDVPFDLRGTEFQNANWQALNEIPFGQTSTYGTQAKRLGRPKAARAIGAATGKNPISIIIPCHRIIGRDGSLTGFAGGLDAKRWLLTHEGVLLG